MTSAPMSARNLAPYGPDQTWVVSITEIPLSGKFTSVSFSVKYSLFEQFTDRLSKVCLVCCPIYGAGFATPLSFSPKIIGPLGKICLPKYG